MAHGGRGPADVERGGLSHPHVRRDARCVDGRGRPEDARLLRLPGRPRRRDRRAPRRHAPGVQGDRRGAVRSGVGEGRVRHRDPVPRHQHAGEIGGDRGPVEVPGRATRAAHPGRVHAADRSRRTAGDRRARTRRGRGPAQRAVRTRGLARLDPDLRAHVLLPALVQHGREPRPQLHARRSPPPAELLVRAVPRRPRRGHARARARTRPLAARRVPRPDAVPSRGLRRVLVVAREGRCRP